MYAISLNSFPIIKEIRPDKFGSCGCEENLFVVSHSNDNLGHDIYFFQPKVR